MFLIPRILLKSVRNKIHDNHKNSTSFTGLGISVKQSTLCYTQFNMILRAICFNSLMHSTLGHIRSVYKFMKMYAY
jgi:hypothetical protein